MSFLHKITSLALLATGTLACSGTPPAAANRLPPWVRHDQAGLEPGVFVVGVGSQAGSGPEASDTARHLALAALAEQVLARVRSTASFGAAETARSTLEGDIQATATTARQRTVDVETELELAGASYDLAVAAWQGRKTTFARARIRRTALADHYAARAQADLARAQEALGLARSRLEREPVVGLEALLRAQAALDAQRELAVLAAAAQGPGGPASLPAAHASATSAAASLLEDARARLRLQAVGDPAPVTLSGASAPLSVRAWWDGAALEGLSLAARSGAASGPPARTDASGLARLSLPPLDGPTLFLAVALDGAASDLGVALELPLPSREAARVLVIALEERVEGERTVRVEPSPTGQILRAMLGRLGFRVADELPSGTHAYRLRAVTRCVPSSRADAPTGTLHWYRTEVTVVLEEAATGDTLTYHLPATRTVRAGNTAQRAAEASRAAALQAATDPASRTGLPALLRRRFR